LKLLTTSLAKHELEDLQSNRLGWQVATIAKPPGGPVVLVADRGGLKIWLHNGWGGPCLWVDLEAAERLGVALIRAARGLKA
jgi:hypothetical protein